MKTTIELPDALFTQARRHAEAHGMAMQALVGQSLHRVLAGKKAEPRLKLRDGSFDGRGGEGGNGLTPEFRNTTWKQIRAMVYEGRDT